VISGQDSEQIGQIIDNYRLIFENFYFDLRAITYLQPPVIELAILKYQLTIIK